VTSESAAGGTGGASQHRVFLTHGGPLNVNAVPATPPRTPSTGRLALLSLFTMLAATTACGSSQPAPNSTPDGGPSSPPTSSSSAPPSTPATTPTTQTTSEEGDTVTTIRITVGGETITGELNDNRTAQDLADQLPVDVTLADFNGVEKVGKLPRPLTMDGVPAGADPEINDIGYYRPANGLVFYYGDVGYFNGIVRLGRLSTSDMQLIRRQTGSFSITIEAA
jgi:hypothetical protein